MLSRSPFLTTKVFLADTTVESSADYTLSGVTVSDSIATKTMVLNDPQIDGNFYCEVDYSNLDVVSGPTTISSSRAFLTVQSKLEKVEGL